MAADPRIEIMSLTKSYGGHAAVSDVSFSVEPGGVTGLLGPNGSGKTTILRVLLGLERPTAGRALIGGRTFADIPHPYQTVGALIDASWVHPNRSAVAHLTWIAQASDLPVSRVEHALAEVGLSDVAGKAVGTFSLGMRQRLGLASTVLGNPEVLIYDEPLNGLDPAGVEWVRQFFLSQTDLGRAVLLSSHQLSELSLTAERIVVLGRGALLFDGPLSEALSGGGQGVEVEIADVQGVLDRVERAIKERGWSWRLVTSKRSTRVIRVDGAPLGELAATLEHLGVEVLRIQGHDSLEEAYQRLTADQVEFSQNFSRERA